MPLKNHNFQSKLENNYSYFFKIYTVLLFCFIFIYLIIRALFNEPLHDEIATFFNYIETGKINGKDVIQDAQNHLLNSYISHYLYKFCGNNLFSLRIANLIAFVIYYFGIVKISKLLTDKTSQILLLTALSTVPFMIEYFAYSRGYGLGLSFFIWVLIYAVKWVNETSFKNALILYLFTFFSVFSNLIYFNSACLIVVLITFVHASKIREFSALKNILFILLHLSFLLSIFPFFWLGIILKNGGALYYGSLNGLWQVTGKSLSNLVFFNESNWIFFSLSIFFIFSLIGIIKLCFQNGIYNQLKEKESIIAYFLFGNLTAIILLANILKVNYPENRVGMYLIPLTILLFTFSIQQFQKFKTLLYILLFFPLSFLYKMNLHTSIFSPDDRMSIKFYKDVRSNTNTETTISAYPLMLTTWAFHERKQKGTKLNVNSERSFNTKYDIVLTKTKLINSKTDLSLYSKIAFDPLSSFVAYKRKKITKKTIIFQEKKQFIQSNKEQIPLLEMKDINVYQNQELILKIIGELKIDKPYKALRIDIETTHKDNSKTILSTINQRWFQGLNNLNFPIHVNCMLNNLKGDDKKLLIYIWNPQRRIITFKNGKINLYKIKP